MKTSSVPSTRWFKLLLCLLAGLAIGAVLQAVTAQGMFLTGWLGASALLFICLVLMLLAWQWAGGGRWLAMMIALAFVLRLGVGLGLEWGLPRFAYDAPIDKAGYVFADAYTRDTQAWDLASSNRPILAAFGQEFISDQYGGLLALSAGIYRTISPDAHRPYLILILTAAAAALGIPFVWAALRQKWGEKVAGLACWIMVLFPESVLLGSSQMREPFMISLIAVAFWAVLSWEYTPQKKSLVMGFVAAILGLLLFSSRMVLPAFAVCVGWFYLERADRPSSSKRRWLEWLLLAGSAVLALALIWGWLRSTALWDAKLAVSNSGMVQSIVRGMPHVFQLPFLVSYGLAQPVLSAAIADPAPWVWKIVGILRGIGWYALLPLLVYPIFSVWKVKPSLERRLLVFLMVIVWGWSLISSARAGGDQWDNPRYRITFLVWLAALAAWAWNWARNRRDAWLWRWLAVEAIFLLLFTSWYLTRYYQLFIVYPFWVMVGIIIVFSLAILVGGWIWDRMHARRSSS